MLGLKEKLAQQIPALREELRTIGKEYSNKVISEVTVGQAYGGMRGVKGMIYNTPSLTRTRGW